MPIFDRDTLVDRPTLIDRGEQESKQDEQAQQEEQGEVIGEGGGPTVHGIEFEEGMYEIVAASNLAGVLATGEEDGRMFRSVFSNAASQLYLLQEQGEDITDLVRFAVEKDIADYGLDEKSFDRLTQQPEEPSTEEESVEEEQTDESEESDNVEDIEDELEQLEDDEEEVEEEESQNNEEE